MAEEEKNQAEDERARPRSRRRGRGAEEPAEPEAAEEAAEPEAAGEPPRSRPARPRPAERGRPRRGGLRGAQESPETPQRRLPAEWSADLGPKAKRRLERSRASGPPRPARTPEERATERAEEHRASGERRRRYRAARRRKRGEPGTGTPPAPREPGPKKVRQGTVVSAGGDKTITVEIAVVRRHPTYEKVVRRTSKLHAHDEANQAQEGDVVRVVESRPLSRTKRWRLLEILEKAR